MIAGYIDEQRLLNHTLLAIPHASGLLFFCTFARSAGA